MSNDLMTWNAEQLADNFLKLKEGKEELENKLEEMKTAYNAIRERLLEVMTQTDVLTLKTSNWTITRASKLSVIITNEQELIDELMNSGYQPKLRLDKISCKKMIEDMIAQGSENAKAEKVEYVSIRKAK